PKHKGITCFLLDMQSPGITIRPLVQMTGDAEFNQVFFDQVRVPKSRILGQVNEGWRVAISTLSHERGGIRQFMRLHRMVRMVEDLARQRSVSDTPILRHQIAPLHIDTEVQRLTALRAATKHLRAQSPCPKSAMQKLTYTRDYMRAVQLAEQILGPYTQLDKGSKHAVADGHW